MPGRAPVNLSIDVVKIGDEAWQRGEAVMVRANQHKWLQGHVKRLARGGVAVWVGEANLVVHVPMQLATTHLARSSVPPLMPSSSLLRLPTPQLDRYIMLAVRPLHLSHRHLFQRTDAIAPRPPLLTPPLIVPPPLSAPTNVTKSVNLVDIHANHQPDTPCTALREVSPSTDCDGSSRLSQQRQAITGRSSPSPGSSHRTKQLECIPESLEGFGCSSFNNTAHLTQSTMEIPTSASANLASIQVQENSEPSITNRFSGPCLEVPHTQHDYSTSSASSSSSSSTTPSPGRQSLADRIKKLKLPSSDKSSPTGQPESLQDTSMAPWITVIQDGKHDATKKH